MFVRYTTTHKIDVISEVLCKMIYMNYILSSILGVLLGIATVPLVIYLRATHAGWDDSNFFNVLRVLCHLAMHPNDFTKLRYPDGKNPFWYLTKDEFSEVVNSRPNV